MKKKILLAVDDSIHSADAIKYAVRMSLPVKDVSYTLFHVQPTISQYLLDKALTDFKAEAELKKAMEKNAEKAHRMLEKYKNRIVRMGISEERIDVVTAPKAVGLTKDILLYAERGLYDAIVAGRRGLSRIQKTFMGSISAKLLAHSMVVPVWMVDGDVKSTRIMVAVDGSETSLRMVDYVNLMVAGNPDIKLTLFHVMPEPMEYIPFRFPKDASDLRQIIAQGEKRHIQDFCEDALQKFKDVGIKDDQIHVKIIKPARNTAKAITREAAKGNYGTVVIGRRGLDKAFFLGSVAKHVLDKISGRALWLVS